MAAVSNGGTDRACPQGCCAALSGSFEELLSREWLITNGLGGYASSTVIGCPTRRYHGLLVSARRPPVARFVLLAAVLERMNVDSRQVELANFEFNGKTHPQGYMYLKDFDYELGQPRPYVQFTYQIEDVEVRKRVSMAHGHDLVTLAYDVAMDRPRNIEFGLLPLVAARDFHSLRRKTAIDSFQAETDSQCGLWLTDRLDLELSLAGLPAAEGEAELLQFETAFDWWYNFRYRAEAERGMDFGEDLFTPGWWRCRVRGAARISWTFVGGSTGLADARARTVVARAERASEGEPSVGGYLLLSELYQAADQFVVRRHMPAGRASTTILAGYHWFGDWGRDTCISLPGLLLFTARHEQAREVLSTFAEAQSEGLIPNRFTDDGVGCDYNSVDASLWFVQAADAYLEVTGDRTTWDQMLLPACMRVVDAYAAGTRYGIRLDGDDGLLACGDPTTQLTWMDAKQGDITFTPRYGKPVEVQALWYHILCILAKRLHEADLGTAARCEQMAARTRRSFARAFWNHDAGCLYDCLRPEGPDPAIRPNQIFAVSLADSPLPPSKQRQVVDCVREHLLTPVGLRSLSPSDPAYHGRYVGDAYQRDAAYHQGTVWAWLMGPFVEAHLRAHNFSSQAREQAREWIRPLCQHLTQAGQGSISEIFDGDPPHTPRGCVAQAWSVAELIRAYHLIQARVPSSAIRPT